MNNSVFLNKVKDVIKEVDVEDEISFIVLNLKATVKTIEIFRYIKSDIEDLCSFLNGKAFDEMHMGITILKISDFIDLQIDLNTESKTLNELLLLKATIVFIKDLFQECIDEELWNKLNAIAVKAQVMIVEERKTIEDKLKLIGLEESMTKDLKYTRSSCIHTISTQKAKYELEKENKKESRSRLSVYSKRIAKNLKRLIRKEDKISIVILSCPVTNKELGFYIESISHGISILNLAYINPEFRGLGLFNKLMSHFEMHSNDIACIEVNPEEVDCEKSLYKKWGYTKSLRGMLPNNYLLIREDNISDFYDVADTLNQAA